MGKTAKGNKFKGHIVVIVAPSGSGKTTLIARLKDELIGLQESVSFTTRPIREGEEHGQAYFFITPEEFKAKINKGDFLEWAIVHANYYGTSKDFVRKEVESGHDLLFDLDVQGADALKKFYGKHAKVIFISPPSIEELERRLRHRGTDSEEVIQVRLLNARKEMQRKEDYDYLVVNDDLDKAYTQLKEIITDILKE
jgi:guanylate kinase